MFPQWSPNFLWLLAIAGIIVIIVLHIATKWYQSLSGDEQILLKLIPRERWVTEREIAHELSARLGKSLSTGASYKLFSGLVEKGCIYKRTKRDTTPEILRERGGKRENEYKQAPKEGRFQRVFGHDMGVEEGVADSLGA